MKRFKWSTLGFTAVLSLGLLAACGTADDNNNDETSGDTPEAETLVMGTSADYPPFESVDITSDEIIGFDIDIAKHITSELGYDLKIEDMDFNSLPPALQNGRVDFVLSAMTPTEERKENLDFSDNYYDAHNLMVIQEDSGIETLEDLVGKTVGVQLGSIQEEAADELSEEYGFEVMQLNRIPEIVQELLSGRIDAILMEDSVAEGHLKQQQTFTSFEVVTEGETGYAIAFNKDSELVEEFNEKLNEMIESGLMDELINEWIRNEE
ncbi:ABC transporter substrate-binding protein [Alkalihalobacillus alcalophilus ATCC 27647 = CGMCC 1.3604]|uniref:ABC transporter substrate-binding protein n=1 Tax=Alkalihalobacillus alcalophilus ATCC 27647 = CGMCC 1.3604 TaxID=1218173 RepID=A0A094XAU2_ALKAL|nr:transporter substrate-binding domain-containing protein [Alkalihalobacillus alcalophilus]KGA95895.1 ABC transporter substrate-binding protein [Alkalihalobacillus alcalophilus ATCC 27647 = CGMCC 1.3604]MED1562906.1 transporter substrate-binding domain-containing protein [Alkalihalobacillus alcalophilus]THG90206.1 ABC transporter substrate-binding protein [Alkalihalobacillus alcalophilus ATCC 27647 = CGMCC 1.3604]